MYMCVCPCVNRCVGSSYLHIQAARLSGPLLVAVICLLCDSFFKRKTQQQTDKQLLHFDYEMPLWQSQHVESSVPLNIYS